MSDLSKMDLSVPRGSNVAAHMPVNSGITAPSSSVSMNSAGAHISSHTGMSMSVGPSYIAAGPTAPVMGPTIGTLGYSTPNSSYYIGGGGGGNCRIGAGFRF